MTATPALTTALQQQVKALEHDLRSRVESQPDVDARWREEYAAAVARKRTAATWQQWRDERVMQAAVAWVLTTVFVRYCEDNTLVRPVWIAGPDQRRRQEAIDAQLAYFRDHPTHTDREWIEQAVGHLAGLPATAALVDQHSPLHLVAPSGDAAMALLAFWRERDEDGALVHDLRDGSLSTRFLGDLYQDLSQYARDTYALLQTPEFVEEFILDRTLEPALAERPLEGFRLIDPTCGSGHFLLGAFARLVDRWHKHAPNMDLQSRVQTALDAIHGVDLNPFAVAIARFRLTVAALQECGLRSLEDAPAFEYHLTVGDSLLHGSAQKELAFETDLSGHAYTTEDLEALHEILHPGRYDVVVGNPPYITARDKALNSAYRNLYTACKGTYALTVPFMECFFGLAKQREGDQPAGWTGQITSNSFMKREFGAPLIEEFLPKKDLRLVVDTSGAYIPGHGTPTVIVVGCNQNPVEPTIRVVLGLQGKPDVPDDPANGEVWQSIVRHVEGLGHEDKWTSVVDLKRPLLARHPWSLMGGGVIELRRRLEFEGSRRLGAAIAGKIGFASFPGSDDCFLAPLHALRRDGVPDALCRQLISGDAVRDWTIGDSGWALVPYTMANGHLVPLDESACWARRQWRYRAILRGVIGFGGAARVDPDQPWWAWYRWVPKRYETPLSIVFGEVATHNHFAIDRGGKVINRTAPVIKLHLGSTEENYLSLLAVLNSSIACFWLKQVCFNKGGDSVGKRGARVSKNLWQDRFAFNGTNIAELPLPPNLSSKYSRLADVLGRELAENTPSAACRAGLPSRSRLDAVHVTNDSIRGRIISIQEELDWEAYRLYGMVEEDLAYLGDDLPPLSLGERAFEIALARKVERGEEEAAWFTRHGSTPITEIPAHWPAAYRDLVQRRLDLIASDRFIRLLEKPEYKRRWSIEPWEKREKEALRDWLLDRLEDRRFWFDAQGRPRPRSVAQLADDVARDADLSGVLALWAGRPDAPVTETLVKLLDDQAVPYLAAYRYKDSGLRKREAWEHVWDEQRREDRGERGEKEPPIPVPPKYTSGDFTKTTYWQHRGKLDVPKERFVLYPNAGRDTDPTPLLGWAGWDHAQQALALNVIIQEREADGWADERLVPLVAGLAELQPWIDQWHAEVDPAYGTSPADFCRQELTDRREQVGRTLEELRRWRPAPATRRGRRPRTTGAGT